MYFLGDNEREGAAFASLKLRQPWKSVDLPGAREWRRVRAVADESQVEVE
jgi:hypothetical protein